MSFLLDTNVVSEIRKPAADPYVRAWFASVPATALHLSVLVAGEIRQGVERLRARDPAQCAVYERWLAGLLSDFRNRLLPIDPLTADIWGQLNARMPLPVVDGLIAATAKARGLTVVTRNTAHFRRTGVRLLNPFEPPTSHRPT